ncbi:XRE family transcriptional regulator [Nocardioides sp.]|uniref:helix-turn-helix domain-containing protein n=1 Tax=Nocardioides sp. TaxID=35761 RepID=UPI002606ACC4|nr:XRE family transcriptional regulator [Nocardioides sp.]
MSEQLVRRAVAENMRRARLAKGLSLRDLAATTGLSAALLSRIEHEDANATLAALSRIAEALDLAFADLTRMPLSEPEVLRAPARGADDSRVRTLFDMHDRSRFEFTESVLRAGEKGSVGVHGKASVEHAYVVTGTVYLTVGERTLTLGPGDAVRFDGSLTHTYETRESAATMLTLLTLPED